MNESIIKEYIKNGKFRISDHAVKRMIQRNISLNDIKQAVLKGEIIEEYSGDKYSPSCLIYGQTDLEKDLHVLLSFPPNIVIVTIYEPDPLEWIECKIRR